MERFVDKVVMITGAGDVALAVGKRVLSEGAKVAFADFSQQALTAAEEEMKKAGYGPDRVMTATCDVRSQETCDAAVAAVVTRWGKVDTLVATAGIIRHMPIDEMGEKDWQDVVDINLGGVFRACKAVVPGMKERKYGRIVIISSIGGRTGRNVGVNYAASKAGIIGLTKSTAKELAARGIRVNAIAPGFVETEMTKVLSEEARQAAMSMIAMKRFASTDDIADLAVFLASDKSSYITGQVISVDGGMAM